MFDKQYKFYGSHAFRVDELTNVFDQNSKAKLFNRNVDIYVMAPLVGFLYGRTADISNEKNKETNTVHSVNVMGDRVIYSQNDLKLSYQLIMLLDENYEPDLNKRIDKVFRHYGEDPKDEKHFDAYVREGVDVLYKKLIQGAESEADYIGNIFDFIEDFRDKFNDGIEKNELLKYFKK